MDEYRRNWAIRFLREAKSDLYTADKTPIQAMSISFAVMAMRKAQTSVYYSVGDPSYLTPMVDEAVKGKKNVENSAMEYLIEMELVIRSCISNGEKLGKDNAMRNAKVIIELASKILSLMTRSKIVEFA
jgi:hypothetical protein